MMEISKFLTVTSLAYNNNPVWHRHNNRTTRISPLFCVYAEGGRKLETFVGDNAVTYKAYRPWRQSEMGSIRQLNRAQSGSQPRREEFRVSREIEESVANICKVE